MRLRRSFLTLIHLLVFLMGTDAMTRQSHAGAYPVEYKTTTVAGIQMFYREAGPKEVPIILLLHGFPSSSRMFATLMPLLADTYHLIAPDYPGFGHSDAPSPDMFAYTFDHLAACVAQLIDQLGVTRYALYLQDYGGPVGFRLAVAHPERVTALIIQNAVVHLEGLSDAWTIRKAFWQDRAAHADQLRQALLSRDVARQRHTGGVANPERIDPDTWTDEFAFLTKPGMDRIQLELMFDYRTNVEAYPRWQAYLRAHQPPALVVWGKNDPLFTVAGALAFAREVPAAEIHLLNAGHFALDEEVEMVAMLMQRFLARLR
jgi:pimeloyl-ACP methyl ester carboxylesterase